MSGKPYIVIRPVHGSEYIRVNASSKRDAINKVNGGNGVSMGIDIYKTSKATSASKGKRKGISK